MSSFLCCLRSISLYVFFSWLCEGSGWSLEWICIKDMSTPKSRIPMFQTHRNDKGSLGQAQKNGKNFHCRNNRYWQCVQKASLLSAAGYRTPPRLSDLPPLSYCLWCLQLETGPHQDDLSRLLLFHAISAPVFESQRTCTTWSQIFYMCDCMPLMVSISSPQLSQS